MADRIPTDPTVDSLIQGTLPWNTVVTLMREAKDPARFDKLVASWQARVPWTEPILMPLAAHLFIVNKSGRAIIKTECGAELCGWRENWKMACRILVRDTDEKLARIFPDEHLTIDPRLVEVREFICPQCGTLLDVDVVPPTYPVDLEFEPDLEAFYAEWLHRPLGVSLD